MAPNIVSIRTERSPRSTRKIVYRASVWHVRTRPLAKPCGEHVFAADFDGSGKVQAQWMRLKTLSQVVPEDPETEFRYYFASNSGKAGLSTRIPFVQIDHHRPGAVTTCGYMAIIFWRTGVKRVPMLPIILAPLVALTLDAFTHSYLDADELGDVLGYPHQGRIVELVQVSARCRTIVTRSGFKDGWPRVPRYERDTMFAIRTIQDVSYKK